jgi:hypothetical protein
MARAQSVTGASRIRSRAITSHDYVSERRYCRCDVVVGDAEATHPAREMTPIEYGPRAGTELG